ncbi:MAG: aconitate hydratase [Cycloclasticus sp. symbiont of Bathymodiolus heckerae]|nr:MAG: aconitate hydratase [Cycloclasticus sp. symbiont of Bathymodiolus heckerae]
MIRLLILISIVLGAIYLVRWFLTTPAETVAANIRKSLWLFLGLGLIFLAVSGKLNIIFAFIGSAIPLIARHLPNLLRVLGIVKTIKSARENNQPPAAPKVQSMNNKEALDILGLKSGASKKDITDAHKRLMQKNHPDKGGSEHLATQINHAKKTLLNNHE